MLILTRKPGEKITIGDDIIIRVIDIKKGLVRIGIEAPRNVEVFRHEIYLKIREENVRAAGGNPESLIEAAKLWQNRISLKKET